MCQKPAHYPKALYLLLSAPLLALVNMVYWLSPRIPRVRLQLGALCVSCGGMWREVIARKAEGG